MIADEGMWDFFIRARQVARVAVCPFSAFLASATTFAHRANDVYAVMRKHNLTKLGPYVRQEY